ncbi:MAG: nucleoside triphosphate pyrophosphohydrolase [Acidobacteria bacterium]|nr:nucleoside triphosphate pyrophosphohydrolase [Acidobacteriota bacterium]
MSESAFDQLVQVVDRLRGPGGCPWDREQTIESVAPMTVEEAYEVVEAIEKKDWKELKGELGDLAFQVLFYAHMAREAGEFDIDDVLNTVREKMIRRHPHVFGAITAETSVEVLRNWEEIKSNERSVSAGRADASVLDGVSTKVPALIEAHQLTSRSARVGFDWESAAGALKKLDEEAEELRQELQRGNVDRGRVAEELGDMFLVLVNVSRLLGVDAEIALRSTNRKFRRRFAHIEGEFRRRGWKMESSRVAEMERFWEEGKEA